MDPRYLHAAAALFPAFVFLAALCLMDSFKLVRPATVGAALLYGAIAAKAWQPTHAFLLDLTGMDVHAFARYVSPLTEEAVKALFIAFLLWQRRVGFLVDAAVLGFAVGTGFAIVENMIYLRDLGQATLGLWIVLPLIVMTVFERSERATREWVGSGLDLDLELLQLVLSEHFQMTRLGGYLRELREHFEGPV